VKRATPDSNILVSAIVFGGKPGQLLEMAINGEVTLVISPDILGETLGVLTEKFKFSNEQVLNAFERLRDSCIITPMNPPRLKPIAKDPDDDRIIECAVANAAEVIISGDKHLLELGSYRDIKIVRLTEFLAGPSIQR
jgi:putative PIN family toxin of toxin-antitoxin system